MLACWNVKLDCYVRVFRLYPARRVCKCRDVQYVAIGIHLLWVNIIFVTDEREGAFPDEPGKTYTGYVKGYLSCGTCSQMNRWITETISMKAHTILIKEGNVNRALQ